MEIINHLDTWIAIFTISALIIYVANDIINRPEPQQNEGKVDQTATHQHKLPTTRRRTTFTKKTRRLGVHHRKNTTIGRSPEQNATIERSPDQNTNNDAVHRSPFTVHRSSNEPIPANIEELQQLAKAIQLYTLQPNKQKAIEESFPGVSKGESPRWARASLLFDTALRRKSHVRQN